MSSVIADLAMDDFEQQVQERAPKSSVDAVLVY